MAAPSNKQKKFAKEYLVDLNATKAAIRAGYSEKSAYSQGHDLLKKPEIQDLIQKGREEAEKRTEVSLDRVIEEMAKVAFSDLRKTLGPGGVLLDPSEWDDDTAAAIASLEVVSQPAGKDENGNTIIERVHKIKTWDKMSALEKLGRHLGLGDKKKDEQADALNNILSEISRRGSAAPIATAYLYRDEDKDEG